MCCSSSGWLVVGIVVERGRGEGRALCSWWGRGSGWSATFSLDLWMSSLYSFLATSTINLFFSGVTRAVCHFCMGIHRLLNWAVRECDHCPGVWARFWGWGAGLLCNLCYPSGLCLQPVLPFQAVLGLCLYPVLLFQAVLGLCLQPVLLW